MQSLYPPKFSTSSGPVCSLAVLRQVENPQIAPIPKGPDKSSTLSPHFSPLYAIEDTRIYHLEKIYRLYSAAASK